MSGTEPTAAEPIRLGPDPVYDRDRMDLIDTLAAADGQDWYDFWQNPEQRRIGETMYGKQADAILASSWLAARVARVRADIADEIEEIIPDPHDEGEDCLDCWVMRQAARVARGTGDQQ